MLDRGDFADPAVRLALLSAAAFFLTGLLTGVWKYLAMTASSDAIAPPYVDIAHRASLLYSFAALLIAHLARLSAWSPRVNYWATLAPLTFFGLAIGGYLLHGVLNDTDNQFRKPQSIGAHRLPQGLLHAFMMALMVAEIGGAAVLVAGTLRTAGLI